MSRRILSTDDVLRKCAKEVTPSEAEAAMNECRKRARFEQNMENREVSVDLKKMMSVVASINTNEDAVIRIDKLDNALAILAEKGAELRNALDSALFSTESELFELCGAATKETINKINGPVSIDPVEIGEEFAKNLKEIAKVAENREMIIEGRTVNDLLILTEEDEIPQMTSTFFKNDEKQKKFADQLAFLDSNSGIIEAWIESNQSILFENDPEQILKLQHEPAIWENTNDIEFMIALVNMEKIEKVKKVREKGASSSRKKNAELVKLSDKSEATIQEGEVSILKELLHLNKMLKNVLKQRKADNIPYYEVILDPSSFAKTVENMFYVSYLIRDRKWFLVIENDVPILKYAAFLGDDEKKELERTSQAQSIAQFDYKQWKQLRTKFKTPCNPEKNI